MCGNNNGFGNCWWIIILILLFCCCGCGNGNGIGSGCGCGGHTKETEITKCCRVV